MQTMTVIEVMDKHDLRYMQETIEDFADCAEEHGAHVYAAPMCKECQEQHPPTYVISPTLLTLDQIAEALEQYHEEMEREVEEDEKSQKTDAENK